MLQALHDKSSSWFVKIILGVIVIVFGGFFGIQSYMTERTETFVAKVDSHEISQAEFRSSFDNYRAQMQRMMGGKVDPQMFEGIERKREVLERLIDDQLIAAANEKLGIAIPAQRVRDEILRTPGFQTNGQFDKEQYKAILSAQRMTPVGFEGLVRHDLEVRELPNQITQTVFVTDQQLDAYLRLRDQTRTFRYVNLEKPKFDSSPVEDSEIEAYYKAHAADYTNPEQVSLQYLEVDAMRMKPEAPDDAALKARYEEQKSHFATNEQRLTSHILVKVDKNADADAQKAALEKASAIAKEAKTTKDFAKLAKEKSDDLGSKAQGGDLGWLEKGTTEVAFESALFAMQKGEISDPVLSPEGYHIIQLRDLRAAQTKSFDEVKAQLNKEYLDSERERLYSEASGKLTDMVYQDPSSLEPAAKALGLALQTTKPFSRKGGMSFTAHPMVLKAAFSDSVLVEGNTSDPIELGPNHVVVFRIAEHQLSTPKPLAEVRDAIRAKVTAEHIAAQAKLRADEFAARLAKGDTLEKLAEELKTKPIESKDTARSAVTVDTKLVGAVFALPRNGSKDKPNTSMVALGNDAYALVQLDSVADGDPSKVEAAARDAARNQLVQALSAESTKGFIQTLRKAAKITVAEDRM